MVVSLLHINFVSEVTVHTFLQTITGAMSTLTPPVALEKPENQPRVDWIQDYASAPDFDYPPEFYEHTEELWKDKGVQVVKSKRFI